MSLAVSPEYRVGWCPGALRPMRAGDGLLVRIKPRGSRLSPATLSAIAALSLQHGNAALTLTARANLQLRGVAEGALPRLTEELGALGLLDATPEAEAVRNVVTSPFAATGDPVTRAAAALEERLATDPALWRLPAKFSWAVDGPGALSLGPMVGADVHVTVAREGTCLVRLVGSSRAATVAAGELPEVAARLVAAFLCLCADHGIEPHRMRDVVTLIGAGPVFDRAGLASMDAPPVRTIEPPIGPDRRDGASGVGVAFPFGLLTAATLARVADAGASSDQLRLTPWRGLLIPGVAETAPLVGTGSVVDPRDLRLRVAACVGAPACGRATTPVPADAGRLAAALPSGGSSIQLHVSGCAKGCAHAGAAPITLVGRDGLYDLVIGARPADTPTQVGLRPEALASMLPALLTDLRA